MHIIIIKQILHNIDMIVFKKTFMLLHLILKYLTYLIQYYACDERQHIL